MEKKFNPEFSEPHKIRRYFRCWDPVPDFIKLLDDKAIRELGQLQIKHKIKELENELEFYREASKFI